MAVFDILDSPPSQLLVGLPVTRSTDCLSSSPDPLEDTFAEFGDDRKEAFFSWTSIGCSSSSIAMTTDCNAPGVSGSSSECNVVSSHVSLISAIQLDDPPIVLSIDDIFRLFSLDIRWPRNIRLWPEDKLAESISSRYEGSELRKDRPLHRLNLSAPWS